MAICTICNNDVEGSQYVLLRSHGVEATEKRFVCLVHSADEVKAILPDTPTSARYNSPVTTRLVLNAASRSEAVAAYMLVVEAKPQIVAALEARRRSLPTRGNIELRPEVVGLTAQPLAPTR
jgi:GTPase Era involved in 16S rRNA processing